MTHIKELNDLRFSIKESICSILVDKYKQLHDGQLPNWENDEEVCLTDEQIGLNYLPIEYDNTYDDDKAIVSTPINCYIVTLDYNLFFWVGDDDQEVEWTEINTDGLVAIEENLLSFINK